MKKLKYVFIALAVIILAVGGYVLYEFKFKTYDVADEEIDEILEETFEVELPDGTKIVLDQEGNVVNTTDAGAEQTNAGGGSTVGTANASGSDSGEGTTSANDTVENGQTNNDSTSSSTETGEGTSSDQGETAASNSGSNTGTAADPNAKLTVAQIKAKYAGTFTGLENQARSRLSALIGRAKSEYSAKKSNGESIQFGYFYNKYMGAANSMEASVDGAVKGVMALLEKELEANGYDKSHAQSFLQQYEATKKALRDDMLNQALSLK